MNEDTVKKAKKLAKEFIDMVNEMEAEEKELNERYKTNYSTSPKHRGAVKRRSMDLTRALAEMRRV